MKCNDWWMRLVLAQLTAVAWRTSCTFHKADGGMLASSPPPHAAPLAPPATAGPPLRPSGPWHVSASTTNTQSHPEENLQRTDGSKNATDKSKSRKSILILSLGADAAPLTQTLASLEKFKPFTVDSKYLQSHKVATALWKARWKWVYQSGMLGRFHLICLITDHWCVGGQA